MRIFKNKWFTRFARKEKIADDSLVKVIAEIDAGNVNANYGGGVYKHRIGRENEGKSGGYRTVIIYRKGDKAFFVFGFAKNEMDNIDRSDVSGFKALAKILLSLDDDQITRLKDRSELKEIKNAEK